MLFFESISSLFRKPVWIANEVRLKNESTEGIKLEMDIVVAFRLRDELAWMIDG